MKQPRTTRRKAALAKNLAEHREALSEQTRRFYRHGRVRGTTADATRNAVSAAPSVKGIMPRGGYSPGAGHKPGDKRQFREMTAALVRTEEAERLIVKVPPPGKEAMHAFLLQELADIKASRCRELAQASGGRARDRAGAAGRQASPRRVNLK